MAIAKLDFNRGQVVNPLSALGDDLTKSGQIFRQQELDKANLERQANADRRAQEMLNMEKQKYADQLASREAANKYYSQLTGALAPGNIGVQDQATLGTQIAGLGQQAQAAYEQGNKAAGDQLVAQQQSVLSGQLPGMQQAYQTSPQAKIDLLGSINAPSNIDVRDRLGILKDTTAPLDKQLADQAAYAAKIEEVKIRAQERHADKVFQYTIQKAIADQARQTQIDLAKANQANQLKMKELEIGARDYKTDNYTDSEGKVWALTPKEVNARTAAGETFQLTPHGSSGGNGGGSSSKKGTVDKETGVYVSGTGLHVPPSFDAIFTGKGDAVASGDYGDKIVAMNKNYLDPVQNAINRIDVGTGLTGDRALNEENVDRYIAPMELANGVVLPMSTAVKINEMRGLQLVTDSKGKVKWGGTGKDLTEQDLTDLGFKNMNGIIVPADKKVAAKVVENVRKYVPMSERKDESDVISRQLSATNPTTTISPNPVAVKNSTTAPSPYDVNKEDIDNLNLYLQQRGANNPNTSNLLRLLQGNPSR